VERYRLRVQHLLVYPLTVPYAPITFIRMHDKMIMNTEIIGSCKEYISSEVGIHL
jgi:hypothetical protein